MITSKDNKLIKYLIAIKDKKQSRLDSVCLIETYKMVRQMIDNGRVIHIICVEEKRDLFQNLGIPLDTISGGIANFISDASTSDGVFAICKIETPNTINYSRCLILDNLQDPSNLGSIVRSARAFGFDTIFAINSVYPFSFKCIRSSMGYIFDINLIEITYEKLKETKFEKDIKFVCADMFGESIEKFDKRPQNLGVIIGSEGKGVSDILKDMADYTVSIPMQNQVESLNASVSASIFMFNLKK